MIKLYWMIKRQLTYSKVIYRLTELRLLRNRAELQMCETAGPKQWQDATYADVYEIGKMRPIAKA